MNTTASPNTPNLPMPVTKRANGRSLADFGELLHAEKILLASCALGGVAWIGDVVPTDGSDPNKLIRASFLRFLLLGGDEQAPVHEKGVQLSGAWIQDQLSIENCLLPYGMKLLMCKFDEPIIAKDAHVAGLLNLSGSHLLQGLDADRLKCDSGVFLGMVSGPFPKYGYQAHRSAATCSVLPDSLNPKKVVRLYWITPLSKAVYF